MMLSWLVLGLCVSALAAWWWFAQKARPLRSGEAMRPMRPMGYSCASRGPAADACCAALVAEGEDLVDRNCEAYCERTGACPAE